jgi:hypothetical protein
LLFAGLRGSEKEAAVNTSTCNACRQFHITCWKDRTWPSCRQTVSVVLFPAPLVIYLKPPRIGMVHRQDLPRHEAVYCRALGKSTERPHLIHLQAITQLRSLMWAPPIGWPVPCAATLVDTTCTRADVVNTYTCRQAPSHRVSGEHDYLDGLYPAQQLRWTLHIG